MRGVRVATAILILFFSVPILAGPRAAAQDLGQERDRMRMMLDRVSKDIEKNYYDPEMHGLDWKALTQQARASRRPTRPARC